MTLMAHDVQCIALRQLETALRLYSEREDYYSVTTLAGASEGVFGKLLEKRGDDTALGSRKEAASKIHKKCYEQDLPNRKDAGYHPNDVANFLKHGLFCGSTIMEFDAPEEAKDMLNRAIDNYHELTGLSYACNDPSSERDCNE